MQVNKIGMYRKKSAGECNNMMSFFEEIAIS